MKRVPTSREHSTRRRQLRRWLMAALIAGGMTWGAAGVEACDYCDSMDGPIACDSQGGCDSCGGGKAKKPNAIYKALDSIAGGIEGLMGFDKCKSGSGACDDAGCDSCDAGMIDELMMSAPPIQPYQEPMHIPAAPTYIPHAAPPVEHSMPAAPTYSAPRMAPRMAAPRMAAPRMSTPRMVTPAPVQPPAEVRMSEPTIVSPEGEPYQTVPSPTEREQFQDYNALPDNNTTPGVTDIPADPIPDNVPNNNFSPDPIPDPVPDRTPDLTPTPDPTPTRDPLPNLTPDPTPPAPDPAPNNFQPPAPDPTPAPTPTPDAKPPGGGLFDSLDNAGDPFGDDEVRKLPYPYRTIFPSKFRQGQSKGAPTQLHGPQTRARSNAPNTPSTSTGQKYTASQQRSVAQMRQAAQQRAQSGHYHHQHTAQPRPTGKVVHANHQYTTRANASTQSRVTQAQHAQHAQRAQTQYSQAQHARVHHHHSSTSQRASQTAPAQQRAQRGTQRAAQQHATQQRMPQQQSAHSHSSHTHAIQPVYRQGTGQRHSNASYSGYGHTTNRR